MDRIYRSQKGVYDLTRAYYLLGRDQLLERLAGESPGVVLEMGCGTARNLIKLARLLPRAELLGIDASAEMLGQAGLAVERAGLSQRIRLARALAEDTDPKALFGLAQPLDAVLFSYSLSMIPTWREAVDRALALLRPGGVLWAVDFWDQGGWPAWFRGALGLWLGLFHVRRRPELLDFFEDLEVRGKVRLSLEGVRGRYAYLARLEKTG